MIESPTTTIARVSCPQIDDKIKWLKKFTKTPVNHPTEVTLRKSVNKVHFDKGLVAETHTLLARKATVKLPTHL